MERLRAHVMSESELVVPNFGNLYNRTPAESWKMHPLFNPFMTQRPSLDHCQQAMQLNTLLHQFLLQAATLGQHQNVSKRPPMIPHHLLYKAELMKQSFPNSMSTLFHGGFQSPVSQLNETPKYTTANLLTPPLSERSNDSRNNLSSPSFTYGRCEKNTSPRGTETEIIHKPTRKRQHNSKECQRKVTQKKFESTKRLKASRKLTLNEQSPISGILIKKISKAAKIDGETNSSPESQGDIDSKYNVVDKSPESRKKLAKIKNVIGDYLCQLCQSKYSDVYELAEHRCPSIIYIEYKCPECFKVFNCPANLASHRRWHKPKVASATAKTDNNSKINHTAEKKTTPTVTHVSENSSNNTADAK